MRAFNRTKSFTLKQEVDFVYSGFFCFIFFFAAISLCAFAYYVAVAFFRHYKLTIIIRNCNLSQWKNIERKERQEKNECISKGIFLFCELTIVRSECKKENRCKSVTRDIIDGQSEWNNRIIVVTRLIIINITFSKSRSISTSTAPWRTFFLLFASLHHFFSLSFCSWFAYISFANIITRYYYHWHMTSN